MAYSSGTYSYIAKKYFTSGNEYYYYYTRPGAYADANLEHIYIGRELENLSEYGHDGTYHYYTLPPFHGNKSIRKVEIGPNVNYLYNISFSSNYDSYCYGWLEGCTNLEEIRIAGMSSISASFARNATSLKSIELSNNTQYIYSNAFSGCSSLETVILGTKVSSIDDGAFDGCNAITSIYCKAKTPPTYKTDFPRDVYLNCNLYIPFETEDAYKQQSPWNNFWNMSGSFECISDFTYNNIIYSVTSGDNVTIIGNTISEYCDLTIPNQIEYLSKKYNVIGINERAFWRAYILSIIIPENITYISNDAFLACNKLREMTFEYSDKPLRVGYNSKLNLSSSVTPFPNPSDVDERRTGFRNGYYDGLFYGLPIEHLVINRDIELPKYYERVIGSSTSYYERVYNDIIYYPPFYGLTNLKSVEIGENVSAICKNQIEAVVNATPTTMNYTNFGKCDNIEVVISKNPNAPIGGGFTDYVYKNAILNLPNGGKESYNADEYWKNFSNIQTGIINIRDNIMPIDQENVYDLHGRKLNKLQKGINIVNRKKVLMK